MFGKIQLEEFKGLTAMPQKAASAWSSIMDGLVGVNYKPLVYCGAQVVKGLNYWFICEMNITYVKSERKIVLLAINEFEGKYELVKESIEVIL